MGLPEAARAAEPAAGSAADPFAPPPQGTTNPSTDDQEAAVLGTPEATSPNTQNPPPPRPPSPAMPARRPVSTVRARKAPQANDEASGVARAPTRAAS